MVIAQKAKEAPIGEKIGAFLYRLAGSARLLAGAI
jgi:hypothetical protein